MQFDPSAKKESHQSAFIVFYRHRTIVLDGLIEILGLSQLRSHAIVCIWILEPIIAMSIPECARFHLKEIRDSHELTRKHFHFHHFNQLGFRALLKFLAQNVLHLGTQSKPRERSEN
jgi:hypothetical protein